ncbi:type II secretion system protein [Luteimonas sp. SJ-92]|uniref:Type II secretion system protein n=1 Tax=Luteimonas salinisoli TaxID=2752307 RepID=A0A853J7T5_9GAMM|nr:type II secretion system protein [Luteimonas salinisoli]NZA25163.1 type II secretion system protein [Luteimonas salinisoli]
MRRQRHRGFSFIELMAALAIMAILLLIAVPSARVAVQRHKEVELRSALAEIRRAIDRYKLAAEQGRILVESGGTGYPPDLRTLVDGVEDAGSPSRTMIYFLRRVPPDPFNQRSYAAPEESWGLRSYDTPPDRPAAGEDVFDVYSTSTGIGLNGVAYRDW